VSDHRFIGGFVGNHVLFTGVVIYENKHGMIVTSLVVSRPLDNYRSHDLRVQPSPTTYGYQQGFEVWHRRVQCPQETLEPPRQSSWLGISFVEWHWRVILPFVNFYSLAGAEQKSL